MVQYQIKVITKQQKNAHHKTQQRKKNVQKSKVKTNNNITYYYIHSHGAVSKSPIKEKTPPKSRNSSVVACP